MNESAREPFKQKLKDVIDAAFAKQTSSIKNLIEELEKNQVYTALRKNAEGRLYGVTFVDNETKCVFNGSNLGKQYSAAALQNRINEASNQTEEKDFSNVIESSGKHRGYSRKILRQENIKEYGESKAQQNENLLEQLISPKQQNENVPANKGSVIERYF